MVTKFQASSIQAILEVLQNTNPFDKPPVVKAQNIWDESFPDVSSVNAHASDAVFQILQKVETASSSLEKVTSIVITADRGLGKTHIIRRIRKQIQAKYRTLFIYASADKYSDLDFINSAFQRSVAESLEKSGDEKATQWQEIAFLLITDALKYSNSNPKISSASDLVSKFDKVFQNSLSKGKNIVNDLTKAVRRIKPEADPYIIRAIIWTLSEERGALAVKWLAGEPLETQDAVDMRLPLNSKSDKERELDALSTVSKIISLIGEYRPVLVCFDELDTIRADENGFPTVMVVMDLVKRLFGSIHQSEMGKGVVILSLLLPDLWNQILIDKDASAAKICTAFSGKAIDLMYVDPESVVELVSLWLDDFYKSRNLNPPSSVYPFEEKELLEFGKGKPHVREALTWCADRLPKKVAEIMPPPPPETLTPTEKFQIAYQKALDLFSDEHLEDNEIIALALQFAFKKIIDIEKIATIPIEGVLLKEIMEVIPKSKNNGYLNFKVIGVENDEPIIIGISVLQQTYGLSVGAGFRRLLDYETFGLSRGCLIRSRERKLKRNWDSYQYYQQLVEKGGEWVDLREEELKPLLALKYIYDNHEKIEISIKRLDSFAFIHKLLVNNLLIKEILSKPGGQIYEESLEGQELAHLHSEEECQDIVAHLGEVIDDANSEDIEEAPDLGELVA